VGIDFTEIALDTIGVEAAAHSSVEINDSMISKGSTSGIQADSATGDSVIAIDRSEVIANGSGAASIGGSIVTGDTTYAYNSGTALNKTTGNIFTFGTNHVHDNGATGTATPFSPI
jgi:hypothetical protein